MAHVLPRARHGRILIYFLAVFFAAGLCFIPLTGLQNDEALFSLGIYATPSSADHTTILGFPVPLMISSYVGALKAWIYTLVFALWQPSLWSVRVPVLLIGVATLFCLWRFLSAALSDRAAAVCLALLVFDPVFLLTNVYDWGPVALQHLLLAAAFWSFWQFHSTNKDRFLAAGSLLLGLQLWDKAIAVWVLAGLAAAALIVFAAEVRAYFTAHRFAIALGAFLLGCSPLLVSNFGHDGYTLRNNAALSPDHIAHKAEVLKNNLDGSALFGLLTPSPEVSSMPVSNRRTLGFWAFVAAALAGGAWITGRATRLFSFSLIALALSWFFMALTRNAGYGPHHAVLLWPLPQFLIAAVLASMPLGASVLLSLVLAASNLVVLGQYGFDLVHSGPAPAWTHAVHDAADYFQKDHPPARVITLDWGLTDNLRLLTRGQLPIIPAGDIPSAQLASQPGAVFLIHAGTPILPFPLDPSIRKETITLFRGRHGRPAIELLRLHPGKATSPPPTSHSEPPVPGTTDSREPPARGQAE